MKAYTVTAIFVFILSSLFVYSQNLSGTNLDDFIDAIIKENNIPGLSIAVVSHDSVIYAKGFGIKKTGGSDFRLSQTSYNLNYTLAGLIVEIISGESWENRMKERIFSSLKMSETYTDIPTALSFNNFSTPHFVKDGNLVPVQWSDFGIYSPAEGVYSNVVDLAKWIKLQLNNGTFENHSIISPGTLADMQKPQNIAMDLFKEYFNPEANFMTMGIGWFISDYKGFKIIQMGGLSSGTSNLITIIPSKKIGIIIQANKGLVFDSFVKINYKIINNPKMWVCPKILKN